MRTKQKINRNIEMCNKNDETFLSITIFSVKFHSQAFQCDFPTLSFNLYLPSPINSLTEANCWQKSAISSGLKKRYINYLIWFDSVDFLLEFFWESGVQVENWIEILRKLGLNSILNQRFHTIGNNFESD